MKLEDQVCSFELAQKLKDLGVQQESHFHWVMIHPNSLVLPGPSWEIKTIPEFIEYNENDYLANSAFTTAELGEILPVKVCKEKNYIDTDEVEFLKGEGWWAVKYTDIWVTHDENEANARAKMLIYLLENKLI